MKFAKKAVCVILTFAICFSFCSCRVRTTKTDTMSVTHLSVSKDAKEPEKEQGNREEDIGQKEIKADEEGTKEEKIPDNKNKKATPKSAVKTDSAVAKKDKNAVRKNTVKAESTDTDTVVKDAGTDNDAGTNGGSPNDNISGNVNDNNDSDQSEREDLDKTDDFVDDTAIRTAIEKYDRLVSMNNAELYDCQKINVYFEMEQDYVSVNRDSEIHGIIHDAWGYNVAEIKYSAIDSAWIQSKGPNMIIKVVDSSILGENVTTTDKASEIANYMHTRDSLDAVDVLVLSKELFDTEAGKKTAKLFMAKAMYPALYEDLDVMMAFSEMAGKEIKGIYAYNLNE